LHHTIGIGILQLTLAAVAVATQLLCSSSLLSSTDMDMAMMALHQTFIIVYSAWWFFWKLGLSLPAFYSRFVYWQK
jgi:hypothetical protein